MIHYECYHETGKYCRFDTTAHGFYLPCKGVAEFLLTKKYEPIYWLTNGSYKLYQYFLRGLFACQKFIMMTSYIHC